MENSQTEDYWRAFDEQLSAIPGGTSLHPAVLRGMQRPYVNPWSAEFIACFEETVRLLRTLYNTQHDVLVMIGPVQSTDGTARS